MPRSIMRKAAGVAALLLLGIIAYLCLWPIAAEPVTWQAQTPPGFTGAFAPNTRLANLRSIDLGKEVVRGREQIPVVATEILQIHAERFRRLAVEDLLGAPCLPRLGRCRRQARRLHAFLVVARAEPDESAVERRDERFAASKKAKLASLGRGGR